MVRTVDYDSRRRSVLAVAISQYIKEADPVPSEDIARYFDLSPATIRNIFVELETAGYLAHPYTSGGRVPTQKGYRYYVNYLLSQMKILDEEKERILAEYKNQIDELEDVLDKTSEIISTVTRYAGIVSLLEWHDKFFYKGISYILNQPEFHDLGKIRLLISMIEEKERLLDVINRDSGDEKVKVYIGEELGCPEIENCSLVVSSYRIKNKPSGRIAVLGPTRMQYEHIIPALEYIAEVLTEVLNKY